MINRKDILKIFLILALLVGTTAGVVLTQQQQKIEKMAGGRYCNKDNKGKCGVDECWVNEMCEVEAEADGQCIRNENCQCYDCDLCPNTDCVLPEPPPPDAIQCILPTDTTKVTWCCPPGKPLYESGKCTSIGGGGGGGGGSQTGCSSASANKCQGKNPGDSCGSGKKCKALGQTGSDGKPKCSCTTSGGGGGGGGGGSSCDKNSNPTVLDINDEGELIIFFQSFLSSTPPKIALKKNSESCSLSEYDQLIDTKDVSPNQAVKTGIQVKKEDKVCIYGEDIGSDAGPYPFEGWVDPKDNKCGDKDLSSLIQSAQNSGNKIVSQQCWGDYAKTADCDFDDYALIVTVSKTSLAEKIILLFRQQGITSNITSGITDQLHTTITLKKDGTVAYKIENAKPNVDSSGVWTIGFSTDNQGNQISEGMYDILVKGTSHLQKRFAGIQIKNDQTNSIDKSSDTKDELKAGDVNNDNAITIEDISIVLKSYTDFKVPVNKNDPSMVRADINKDGFITIDDVALVALNWSNFVVKGDE